MTNNEPSRDLLRVGERVTVTIDGLATGGDGVTHYQGFTLFVPRSAPGDVAEVEVTQVTTRYGRARLLTLRERGADRVPSPCPLAEGCEGCQLQHLSYPAQLRAKEAFVRDGLERIGRLRGVEVRPVLGMADPWRYRNKGEFVAAGADGRIRLGYHGDGAVLPLEDCPIQHPLSMRMLHCVEEIATRYELPLAQLITRVAPHDGTALAILVCREWHARLPEAAAALSEQIPEVVGVLWSEARGRSLVHRTPAEPLSGRGKLTQRLGNREYTVSAESFFQVNNEQGARLVELAEDLAANTAQDIFADGYCGVGTFLIPLAAGAGRAIGIEEHPAALQDAQENLARYALHDVKLYEGRVEVILPRLLRKGRSVDVALLDPPRKGCGRQVLKDVAALGATRIILVSCDPATLGRDAGDLATLGYHLEAIQPIDMFPQTWHVETIALCSRTPRQV